MGSIRNDSLEEGIKDAQQNQKRLLFSKENNISWINRFGKECKAANSSHLEINQQHKTTRFSTAGRAGQELKGPASWVLAPPHTPDLSWPRREKQITKATRHWRTHSSHFSSDMLLSQVPFKEGCSSSITLHWSVWNTPALEAHVCNLPFPPLP